MITQTHRRTSTTRNDSQKKWNLSKMNDYVNSSGDLSGFSWCWMNHTQSKKKVFFFIHLFKYSLICALAFCRYQSMILVVWYFSTRLPPSPQKIRNLDKNHHSLFYQWSWVFGIITVDSHHHLGYRDFMLTTDDKKTIKP